MDKVRDDFDVITYETDSILYYNPEDLYDEETKEKIKEACRKGREEGREEGRVEGRREGRREGSRDTLIKIALNLKNMNISLEKISIATGLSIKELEDLIK